ncbi:MAG TPA: 4-hydroxybenzoate octaprenyltransferase [Rhizomicrobium sp.]|jgi:4-hydroxybenzoate polyprenyltransferase
MSAASQPVPADALPHSWVDFAPAATQPYLRLMRLDRPIGATLLFLPCIFGLAVGATSQHRGFGAANDWTLLALFGIGAIVMRGAGCTYNDIVDREFDARVARTRGRPIPSGAISVRAAWIFLAVQCAIGLLILLQLNAFSIVLGAGSLILVAVYPYMKRITWWPQAWLGLTFNWGALLGFSAVTAHLSLPAWLLFAGCFFWTMGYDTIYAHQDVEDDALVGVRSTARLFGDRSRPWISAFYMLTLLCLAAAIFETPGSRWDLLFLVPVALHFLWQTVTLEQADSANCLRVFRANREAGLLIAAAFILLSYLQ